MPVTKKSGAIFVIYADSPPAARPATRSVLAETSESASTSQSQTSKTALKPRTTTSRRALASVEAPTLRIDNKDKHETLGEDRAQSKGKGKAKIKDKAVEKGALATGATDENGLAVAARKLPPRKREVSNAAQIRVQGSPTKKTRSTPIKKSIVAPEPIEGSPATRTRSKTRAGSFTTSTPVRRRTQVETLFTPDYRRHIAVDDHAPGSKSSPADTAIDIDAILGDGRGALNAKTGKPVADYLKALHAAEQEEDDEASDRAGPSSKRAMASTDKELLDSLKGKEVMGKVKGKRVAEIIQREPLAVRERHRPSIPFPTSSGDRLPATPGSSARTPKRLDLKSATKRDENTPITRSAKSISARTAVSAEPKSIDRKVSGKSKAVLADVPLVDVSEAYGAEGVEPSGFRTQVVSDCKSTTFPSRIFPPPPHLCLV